MDRFWMNGIMWKVRFVSPMSKKLIDRTGTRTVATTDPISKTVYISNNISGDFLDKVFIHEMGHCAMFSFDLLTDIHKMVYPEYWITMEEFICNFIADYGYYIYNAASKILGHNAIKAVPIYIERMIA